MDVGHLLGRIDAVILNPLIELVFAIAFVYFFIGIIQLIASGQTDDGREQGKRRLLYGLIGMFVMFSAYGLIHLILGTFHISQPANSFITF